MLTETNGSSLTSGPLHIIDITPELTFDSLVAEVRSCIATQRQAVLLCLPVQPVPFLLRPEDFRAFTRLKRELGIPIHFALPGSGKLREWAKHAGLPAYSSQEEAVQALGRGLLRSATLTGTGVSGGLVTRPLPRVLLESKKEQSARPLIGAPSPSAFDPSTVQNDFLPTVVPAPRGRHHFVVHDYIEGERLQDYLERLDTSMEEAAVLGIAAQLLEVLVSLEEQSPPVMHGDIHPGNIVIDARNRVHLIGFPDPSPEGEQEGQGRDPGPGTPGYASPERLRGEADSRSDLYGLAATLHRMLTNQDPNTFPTHNFPPISLFNPAVSAESDRLLAHALTYDPLLRYQSASEMKRDVEALLAFHRGSQREESESTPPLALNTVALETGLGGDSHPGGKSSAPGLPWWGGAPASRGGGGRWRAALAGLLLLVVVAGTATSLLVLAPRPAGRPASAAPELGIGVSRAPDGETIGLSDGSFAFDTGADRPDAALKLAASAYLRAGDIGSAEAKWHAAIVEDPNDPEALVYLEDQRVLASGYPYITLVIGSMFSGTYVGLGRDDLQGAYLAQKAFNDGYRLPGGVQLRLLVASTGNERASAVPVARQIVVAASRDRTLLGVMGWPYSSRTLNVVPILAHAHLPLLSQMASSVTLSGISPGNFFRIVPPDSVQATLGAQYIEHSLHAHAAALFVDTSEAYSESIGASFQARFVADGNAIVATEHYTVGQPATIPALLADALAHHPDILYFAGMAADANTLLADLPVSGPDAHLLVMGGDGLYETPSYSTAARANFPRLRFSAFAYHDEWTVLGYGAQAPAFFRAYPATFDPQRQHPSTYGSAIPNGDAMLSYDGVVVLLEAARLALGAAPGRRLQPGDLRQGLTQIRGPNAVQGITGQIALGPDGNPINKAVVMLAVSPEGYIQMQGAQGQFLKGSV